MGRFHRFFTRNFIQLPSRKQNIHQRPPSAVTCVPHSENYNLPWRHCFSLLDSTGTAIVRTPKCLLEVDCTNLLMGGSHQYEDFSSTCWLENHLHLFGTPPQTSDDDDHSLQESSTSTSSGDSADGFSVDSAESVAFSDVEGLIQNSSSIINLQRYSNGDQDFFVVEPPPYANDPPPSYEEAVSGPNFLEDDNSDFMW